MRRGTARDLVGFRGEDCEGSIRSPSRSHSSTSRRRRTAARREFEDVRLAALLRAGPFVKTRRGTRQRRRLNASGRQFVGRRRADRRAAMVGRFAGLIPHGRTTRRSPARAHQRPAPRRRPTNLLPLGIQTPPLPRARVGFYEWSGRRRAASRTSSIPRRAAFAFAGLWRSGARRRTGSSPSQSSPRKPTRCSRRSTTACRSSSTVTITSVDDRAAAEVGVLLRPYPADDWTTKPVPKLIPDPERLLNRFRHFPVTGRVARAVTVLCPRRL